MDRDEYSRAVKALTYGKRLPDGVYLHRSQLGQLPLPLLRAVKEAQELVGNDEPFDVIRFATKGVRLSLLHYPAFFDAAFPTLARAWLVDLAGRTAAVRDYDAKGNPPILHRKELLLAHDDPKRAVFETLTIDAERYGLFSDSKNIGTKRSWEARLHRLRLRVEGHALKEETERTALEIHDATVERHRTALQRYSLSAPMQALWRHGLLNGSSVFDYGCGRGDDLRILRELGVVANGWDPHFAPSEPKLEADVVNIGYVINVVEDLRERRDALVGAFKLARKALAVSALIGGRTAFEQHRLFRDGVLTSRGTFQKYFSQQELREYIATTLKRDPIAVAPGLFFVFRTDEDEQSFLAARQMQARCHVSLPRSEAERPKRPSRWEVHAELLDGFWERCLALGRLPKDHEFPRMPELRGALGTPQAVLRRLVGDRGAESLEVARRARMDDLLVYLALNLFERRKSFGHLPTQLQTDIAGFWGGYGAAKAEATRLLFSIGKPDVVHEACREASAKGLGVMDGDHNLQLHTTLVARLPAVLRVYVGAAARLYGDVEAADLVKVHIQSGKLTLLMYDDFVSKALPRLIERIKVDMRAQEVIFFEYGDDLPTQLLYRKSHYLAPDFDHYEEQVAFDEALLALGLDLSGFGPDEGSLLHILRAHHALVVEGFRLRRVRT